jgi:hypothetical protein
VAGGTNRLCSRGSSTLTRTEAELSRRPGVLARSPEIEHLLHNMLGDDELPEEALTFEMPGGIAALCAWILLGKQPRR